MKKIWMITMVLMVSSLMVLAQDAPPPAPGGAALGLTKSKGKDRLIVNFTWDNWIDAPAGVSKEASKSRGFGFYSMADKPFKKGGLVSIAYGLGIQAHSIQSDIDWNNLVVDSMTQKSMYAFSILNPAIDYKKNKIVTAYLDLPIELRFRTKPNAKGKSFKVYAGFMAGVLVNSHTKYVDKESKFKEHNLKNISAYRYGATGRIGFGKFSLYGYYSLGGLFKDGVGSEITPVSVGLSYGIF